jgi:hypothetical protein
MACAAYLERVRWHGGFVCPNCHEKGGPFRIATRPTTLQCRKCRRQIGLMRGTVLQDTHSPLTTWFWGTYLISSMTPGMSAVQFQRQLGLTRYETAFQILHKLRAGMVRQDRDRIGGNLSRKDHVEIDETYIGGVVRGNGNGPKIRCLCVRPSRSAPDRPRKATSPCATAGAMQVAFGWKLSPIAVLRP